VRAPRVATDADTALERLIDGSGDGLVGTACRVIRLNHSITMSEPRYRRRSKPSAAGTALEVGVKSGYAVNVSVLFREQREVPSRSEQALATARLAHIVTGRRLGGKNEVHTGLPDRFDRFSH
jgi:hypothetical protein